MLSHYALRLHLFPLLFIALGVTQPTRAEDLSAAEKAWTKQVGKRNADVPAYAFVKDDPALPRVLLIGDSISIGYTAEVRSLLRGKANVHRIPTNGGDTKKGLTNLDAWLDEKKWDVIHFNWGLHDLKRMKDGKMDVTAENSVASTDYEKNLRELVARLKQTGSELIWASTTPVPEGAQGRIPGDELMYNTVADAIMQDASIPTNNLHAFITPHLKEGQEPANVHFNQTGCDLLATAVARIIEGALN